MSISEVKISRGGPESEETNSTTTTTSSSEADYSGSVSVCSEDHEDGASSDLSREGSRKLIKPDLLAMSQLLNFDEVGELGGLMLRNRDSLKRQSHEIFCSRFFPPNSSSCWSH